MKRECTGTRKDRIMNEHIGRTLKVDRCGQKVRAQLRWYSRVKNRDDNYVG